jgi:hypothetical protein
MITEGIHIHDVIHFDSLCSQVTSKLKQIWRIYICIYI